MKTVIITLVALLQLALPASAEVHWALPNETAQKVAGGLSWGTLGADLALQTYDSLQCPEKTACLLGQLLKTGVALGSVYAIKQAGHRKRPCAPDCGAENPNDSFPSGHAALAFQAVGGNHLKTKLALAIATAVERVLANKHYPTDVLAGAGIGLTISYAW